VHEVCRCHSRLAAAALEEAARDAPNAEANIGQLGDSVSVFAK
jgi:hypothetical protein